MSIVSVFKADEIKIAPNQFSLEPEKLPPNAQIKGRLFDGYPVIVKEEVSPPKYRMKILKDIMVKMRDGVHLAVDIYLPDAEGEKFPCLVAWGMWGKDNQETVLWLKDLPQPYYTSPWWDGSLEAGDIEYFVSRGYVYVIPDPRGIGKSEGGPPRTLIDLHKPEDIYDLIEWVAQQPWCNGKVGMIGPSSYSLSQYMIATNNPPPHLVALFPIGSFYPPADPFTGMIDLALAGIFHGGHIHDSSLPVRQWGPPMSPEILPKDEFEKRLKELLEHPDIKFHPKVRSSLVYPREPILFDYLMSAFHPTPVNDNLDKVTLPIYIGVPAPGGGGARVYWSGFEAYNKVRSKYKKFLIFIPGEFPRPFVHMQYEMIRWFDYWLKGIDNGIMDEPPVKIFMGGVNKWKFEDDWPPKDIKWINLYLRKGNKLSTIPESDSRPDVLYQPMPLKDPTVYSLNYYTDPFTEDTEIVGPTALHLEATIDQDDVNWMITVVDVSPDGSKQLMTEGWLRGSFRAIDENKSKPWAPVHKVQDPVPVPKGEKVKYDINLMPITWVIQKGHRIGVIIRTQDDMYSRLAIGGVYFLPRMVDTVVNLHLGPNSYIVLPVRSKE
ncbi:CocE/NonD family hydrolase [Caldivirga maquilingensis]|uniref:X-Pro dipeptidyl-peptidase domain protein n=1 Tax=Caldivirga maquilingensis (strain ATCC 700844 / DSM 13496 / JCM 10307 / IC-167) TaxID=397948 RepID=A8M9A4_CALMQ|nr:CocE/NonD family hydrolase [Caldivirga maquilingensis]ABW02323.1 X-Pro dipeptidyl-peptidase domain protein [Caldivirga maquilingensis IC-167]